MPDEFEQKKAAGGEGQLFGWSNARRRLGAPPLGEAPPAAENRETASGPAAPGGEPAAGPRLRPSGQLAPARGRWGIGDEREAPAAAAPAGPPQRPPMLRAERPPEAAEQAAAPPQAIRRPSENRAPVEAGRGNATADAARIRLHELLIEELEHGSLEKLPPEQQRDAVIRAARELIAQDGIQLGGMSRDELLDSVADEVLGLGPLEPLLRDPQVSEVMVNELDKIFYEQNGRIFRSPARFRDKQHIMRIIERIVAPLGRRID